MIVLQKLSSLVACCLIASSLFVASSASAEQSQAEGFTPIFDGKTLEGWHIMNRPPEHDYYATEENFFVKDGAITCFQVQPKQNGGLIFTDKEYGDFELSVDFKSDWGCDSGIFIRTNSRGQGIQILNDFITGGSIGFIYGQGTGSYFTTPVTMQSEELADGSTKYFAIDKYDGEAIDGLVYSISAPEFNEIYKPGEFNTMKIRCVGTEPMITTWVNGTKVMEFDGRTYRGRHLRQAWKLEWDSPSAWDSAKVSEITGDKGHIGFQVHPGRKWAENGSAQYKNIQIKEL